MSIIDKMKKSLSASVSSDKKNKTLKADTVSDTKKIPATTSPAPASTKPVTGINRILFQPLVSEKAAHDQTLGKYTFVVEPNATKVQIKQAIKTVYDITPTAVHVSHMQGKSVRFGRHLGKRRDWKKAIVTLPKGKHIDIHAGV